MVTTILLIIGGILLEVLLLAVVVHYLLKRLSTLKQPPPEVKVVGGRPITSEVVRDGVKDALREISYEEEQRRVLEKKQRLPESVHNTTTQRKLSSRSGGNLIPYGLTEQEQEVLEMFYED